MEVTEIQPQPTPSPSTTANVPVVAKAAGDFGAGYTGRRLYNALVMLVGDIAGLCLALVGAGAAFMWWTGAAPTVTGWAVYVAVMWTVGASLLHLLPSWGLGPIIELRRLSGLIGATFGSAAVVVLAVRGEVEEGAILVGALVLAMGIVPLLRLQAKRLLITSGAWGIPAAIYGGGKTASRIVDLLRAERGIGYNPAAIITDDGGDGPARFDLGGETVPVWHADGPEVRAIAGRVPVAIVAQPDVSEIRLSRLLEDSIDQYQTVLIIPELNEAPSLWVRPRDISGVLGLEIPCNLARPVPQAVKRATDLMLTAVTAPAWGLVCVGIAAVIWLEDRSNPFFFQERVGRNGRSFWTWKFRTMVPDAEAVLQRHIDEDPVLRAEWENNFKLRRDPRLTTVGQVLRTFSLDELPQLVNVLTGDMSLVGPRPLPRYHVDQLTPMARDLRCRVRPGITGLWQVSGRSEAGIEGMEQWDPYYVRNWSLWLDVVVLVRTARAVVQRTGAY